ncbi:uncharacterized protein LOC108141592 isoform X1 [Drosophila elegans]|uniref:uncharacterized protein LOC108141592 isoform X1 n=2 Tax=Drosophila elegans TaxID=30023 RepID=UPI001BC84EE0|nr:uncharacterized protein LOC108141592 isoform X1 [Drosophila elegans]
MDQLITSMLKERKSRVLGLRLLICYLKKSYIKLGGNEHIWVSLIFQSCNLSELRMYGDLIFSAMALLIERIQKDANLSKAFAASHLFKVFECLSLKEIFKNERCTIALLHTIKRCLKYYPKSTKPGTSSIEELLITLIDSNNVDVVHQTGQCWLLLQNIHGNSRNEKTNKIVWKDFQLSLLNNLQYIISSTILASEETIISPYKAESFALFTFKNVKDPFERATQTFQRIFNLIEYFKIALSKPFPIRKYICTEQILGFIQNGLNIRVNQINLLRIDRACFGSFLEEMHIKLMELLEILINVCRTHLRMDFRIILNILMDALERTKSGAYPNQVNRLRPIVYKVISLWCSTLQEGSHCEIISETLVKEIFDDLVPRQPTSLTCQGNSNLKQNCSAINIFSMLEMSFDDEDNYKLCQQAHFCLQKLLSSSGPLLKPSLLKDVHNTLLEIFIQINLEPLKTPYSRNICNIRLEVYKTFVSLLKSRNYGCPVPSEIIITLLDQSLLYENSSTLRPQYNLKLLELMIHPQKADIQLTKFFENLKIITSPYTKMSDSENSKCKSLKERDQLNIQLDKKSYQKRKEQVFEQTGNESNNIRKDNFSETKGAKQIKVDLQDQFNTKIDNNSLNIQKSFEKMITNRFEIIAENNYIELSPLDDSVQNIKETSKESLHILGNNSLESFEKSAPGMFKHNDIYADLPSSYCCVEKCEGQLPVDLVKLDDDKMIADLEAKFVDELK